MASKSKKIKAEKRGETSDDGVKTKGLFDHVKQIQTIQDPDYFDKLSEGEKKSWSNFMILKALSMDRDFVDYSADFFKYVDIIPPKLMYLMLIGLVDKNRKWAPWVKGKSSKYPQPVVDFIARYYEISRQQSLDYVKLLFEMDDGKKIIQRMMGEYGYDEKEISKMFKGEN